MYVEDTVDYNCCVSKVFGFTLKRYMYQRRGSSHYVKMPFQYTANFIAAVKHDKF